MDSTPSSSPARNLHDHELQRSLAMLQHATALTMLFKCSDGSLLSFSPSAQAFYTQQLASLNTTLSSSSAAAPVSFKDHTLADIARFSTATEDCEFTMEQIAERCKSLTPFADGPHTELVVDVAKAPLAAEDGGPKKHQRWFRMQVW
jgi:hypothetical protein